jgi:hypothetical protein
MSRRVETEHWELEVVRGRDVGRRYALAPGESTLGNAINGVPGVELSEEPGSPRRMAPRQASVIASADGLWIRDLESPGGTFVNRQRLLTGQVRPLQPGDVIQLGGVQLQVRREAKPASGSPAIAPSPSSRETIPPARPGPLTLPYVLPGGATCRTWDDFLTLAAQRWSTLREELTSGRLADHLRRVGRTDLLPRPDPSATHDEQLDSWLARLPATQSSAPELDVHPESLVLKASAGGGLVRQTLRITNVGYRLLRTSVRVEPAGGTRIAVPAEFSSKPFATIEHTDLPIEIDVPDRSAATTLGAIVLESNGGVRRVEIRLVRSAPEQVPVATADGLALPIDLASLGRPLGERLATLSMKRRLLLAPLAMIAFRLLLFLGMLVAPGVSGNAAEPRLAPLALVTAAFGVVMGLAWSLRRDSESSLVPTGFAGGMLGVLAGAVGFAVISSIETLPGLPADSLVARLIVWAALGALAAPVSAVLVPPVSSNTPARAEAAS